MIRIALVSDEPLPDSLNRLLERSQEVQILNEGDPPDVLLFHTRLWNREALARARSRFVRSAPALILCERAEEPFTTDSILRKEVHGVLTLTATPEQLVSALRAAAAGLRVLRNSVGSIAMPVEDAPLTPREIEVLKLVADGEGNKSIADLLEISEHTVKFHISSIFQKLHVSSRTEAVKAGITGGLIAI